MNAIIAISRQKAVSTEFPDRIRVAAADRRRRLERHDVGGQYGLSLERGYEVVCHAGDEACEKKRDHGRFAALSEEVHDGEEGPCDAEAEDDELRPMLPKDGL